MATTLNAGNATSGAAISADTTGILQLQSGSTPTTAVTIDTSQRVLIGATSASGFDSGADDLIVGAGSGNTGMTIYSGNTSTAAINFARGTTGSDIYAGGITYNHTNNRMDFSTTDGSGRMRIDSSGNTMIGTTTARAKLTVERDSSDYCYTSNQTGGGTKAHIQFMDAGTQVGRITSASSTTTYSTSSDYRLKKDVQPMLNALATVSALKPVTYKWKSDGSSGQGFIAHELAEIVPDCVTGEKDAVNEDGSINPQGIDTSFLVATLTAAIQELNAKVDAQVLEIQALKGVA
jgi:hypothetical protein